jgi:bifunctional DNase/RNase
VSAVQQVRIASLAIDPRSEQPVVILKPLGEAPGEGRLLPIWIGQPEATAILLAVEGIETPRPMTHDLLQGILESLDTVVERVEITRVDGGTFYAAIVLRGEERTRIVDARPSDSIALAVRVGAPIFVADDVLDEAAVEDESIVEEGVPDEEAEVAEFRRFLESVDPSDFSS